MAYPDSSLPNLSGLKHALHGTSYQLKLGIVVSLANAKKSLDSANDFSFTVTAEDPTAGKFDDIVYSFKDGEKKGKLKIQVKHKLKSPARLISLKDFTAPSDNPFAISKYFTSFCDQQTSKTDLEGFILCTNSDIDDNVKFMWKPAELAITDNSMVSLDFYNSSLFNSIGGKCYQLDYDKLWTKDGTFSDFHKLLRKCSNGSRLARLLVETIKSNKKLTSKNSLFKDYRLAILDIIDRNEPTTNDSYRFTKDFLNPSFSNLKQGYEAFRKQFEDQYRQQFKIDGSVWDHLKLKRLHISKNFLLDDENEYSSSDSFPDDNVDESFKFFCERFRLVCGTKNEQGLDDAIVELWRNLHFGNEHLSTERRKGFVEEDVANEKLFKTNFQWLMNPFAEPLDSKNIKEVLEEIENTLAQMKLKGISDKLRRNVLGSPFRIRHKIIQSSDLYNQVQTKKLLQVETYDIAFGATVLSDILYLQGKEPIFLEDSDFLNYFKQSQNFFSSLPLYASGLIIICNGMDIVPVDMFKNFEMQVFLIMKPSSTQSKNLVESIDCRKQVVLISRFLVGDLIEGSWNRFLDQTILLCSTHILASEIFQNNSQDLEIDEIIQFLDFGKQMEENNEISKKYREIESTYVHRPWIDEKIELGAENIGWREDSIILKSIKAPQRGKIILRQITKSLKKEWNFNEMFAKLNNPGKEHEPIVSDEGKKVLILLGEAGLGKSTNLTWLTWYLRKQNTSSWIVRCNLSDHCTDFKPFASGSKYTEGKVINETEAMKMLYKLVHSSLLLKHEIAEICSNCLVLSDGEANVSEDLMKQSGLSFRNSIQLLVFREKFNAGEIMLLLDGFDEIAPDYKKVGLKFLSHFEQFKGVRKIYLTSRPYGFKKQFEESLVDFSFFQLKPLSLSDKASILYKMMREKWHNGHIDDEEVSDSYKSLCIMVLCALGDMSDIPLNLMMAIDILGDRVYQNDNINRFSETFNVKLFETVLKLSKASFVVEEFVKVKIRHLLYDKNGADKNVADKPEEMKRFEKAIDEAKLLHGLVALCLIFDKSELKDFLLEKEIHQAEAYMIKIHAGSEKTGIFHSTHDEKISFIHRTFVEYLAAWWVIKQQRINHQDRINIFKLKSFWDEERKELRENIDTILAKRHPLHLAIIEEDWQAVEALLSTNADVFYERDNGNRTPLHLLAFYYDFERNWPQFLPNSIESYIINVREELFGCTALDYALYADKHRLILYLLHHGASININFLYEQVASASVMVLEVAKYARYVMEYFSRQAIAYDSHDAYKNMKKICDKVAHYLANDMSSNTMDDSVRKYWMQLKRKMSKRKLSHKQKCILDNVIWNDSVWMLESVIQRETGRKSFVRMIRKSFFKLKLDRKSIMVLKYLMENDPFQLPKEYLWKCTEYAALKDYQTEFKYFFDLYCSRFKIQDFEPCSIQSDAVCYLFDNFKSETIDKISDFGNNICWAKLGIPTEIVIDENIHSLLFICVATVRPSILKYLKESCDLNLCAGVVYPLAMVTNHLFSKIYLEAAIKPSKAYECLLDLASNISDVEATNLLRLAITSNLFEFSKCLIKRYNIDYQAVDKLKGWNVFHLCVSNQRSFWGEEIEQYSIDNDISSYVDGDKTDLFRYLLAKEKDMDGFGNYDKNGRSILHLAIENEQDCIIGHIVARKLGLNDIDEIENLSVEAIPNLTFCYRVIRQLSKSDEQQCRQYIISCILAKQIARILLTKRVELQEQNDGRLLLQEDAKELYHMARKWRSLYLMYYLHREFPSAIPPPIYDADWLACTVDSMQSPDFLVVTKWLLNPNEVDDYIKLYEVIEKYDDEGYDLASVDLEELIKQTEDKLSTKRSEIDVGKIKLLALAVCLKHESMIRYLCEKFNLKIDWKVVIVVMEVAHQSHKREIKFTDGCTFEKSDFDSVYKYLFERASNLSDINAEGRMQHISFLAVQSGLGCMAKFLIKQNLFNVTTTNQQNGWNIFHYYASSKTNWNCCYTENDGLLTCITKRVLEIKSDAITIGDLTDIRKDKMKELCFNSNEGRKSVIHVAVKDGNIGIVAYIILCRLGIENIDEHEIRSSDEYLRFRECYDELSKIAAQLPFNGYYDYLLHRLAKSIHRFLPEYIQHITEQENVEAPIVEDACRAAIMYRSVSTLEYLMIAYEDQMNQALARSTSFKLVVCMMECIRRNRNSIFKVLVGHYRVLQSTRSRNGVVFEKEGNYKNNEMMIDEDEIRWSVIDEFSQDVPMNRDYLRLLILSVAYGRLSMTQFLVEMLQLDVNKSLILAIMKGLESLWDNNYKAASSVYEYLASRCEEKPNLVHLCIQAECYNMLEYLIKEKKFDPNEIDSENGWNAGHYCVSDPSIKSGYEEFIWLVEENDMDCFGVYDGNGRSILHLAMQNGFDRVVEYIINHKLGLKSDNQPWYEWDLKEIEKHVNELNQIIESFPENILQQKQQFLKQILENLGDRKLVLATYKQLVSNQT